MSKLLWTDNEWNIDRLVATDKAITAIAHDSYGLDHYENQIQIIGADQMIDAYASHAMPVMYPHWSFGKSQVHHQKMYSEGYSGLAYEVVINSDPCISYLMEDNTMTMQALVIAHACIGHNNFFKNNYLFRKWTDAKGIIPYLVYAKRFISNCEQKYGVQRVEGLLDSCHALMNNGVDKYPRSKVFTKAEDEERRRFREEQQRSRLQYLWETPKSETPEQRELRKKTILPEPEENLLYFIEKNSPVLEDWEREIVRIVRKVAQYFWPQMQTKVMNEGWASTWHYNLMYDLWRTGQMRDGNMMEFLATHTAVVRQVPYNHRGYNGFNPYYLGFNIFKDIRRMCENPTEEDKKWFPYIAGGNWLEIFKNASRTYKDESFILQFLSPHLIRQMKLFQIADDDTRNQSNYIVDDIHDNEGYKKVRSVLAQMHDTNRTIPQIQVADVNLDSDRTILLEHIMIDYRTLDDRSTSEVLRHFHRLWGFDVHLVVVDRDTGEDVDSYELKAKR